MPAASQSAAPSAPECPIGPSSFYATEVPAFAAAATPRSRYGSARHPALRPPPDRMRFEKLRQRCGVRFHFARRLDSETVGNALSPLQPSPGRSDPPQPTCLRPARWLGKQTGSVRHPLGSAAAQDLPGAAMRGRPRWPKGTTDATGRIRWCLRCLRSDARDVASGLPMGSVSGRAGHDGRRGRTRCLVSASLEAPERPARFLNLRKASYVLVRSSCGALASGKPVSLS